MKHSRIKTLIIVYGLPLFLGLAARIVFFINWLNSPLSKIHEVLGLDMETVVLMGKNFYLHGGIVSLNKLLISFLMLINGGTFKIEYLIITQLIFGLGTSLLTASICLMLFGKRWAACAAGILAALYSPALMYEGLALRETLILFVTSLAFFFVLKAQRKRFKGFWLPLSAFFVFLPCMERISMFSFAGIFSAWILFYTTKLFIKTRKPKLSKTLPHFIKTSFLYGIFALLAISPLIYHVYNESEGYCKYICKYFERGRDFENDSSVQNRSAIQKAPIEKAKDSRNQTRKYEKVIAIFKALDITNNVNYYFLKEKVIPLKFLIGPLFLLPLALTGLALMLFRRRLFKKEFFLFAVIVSFSLPVYFYMPLGRYRLGMLPVFCISAVYPLIFIANKWRIKAKNSNLKVLLLVIFYMLILYWEIPENFPIRSEDYLAYGMAMEKYSGYNELVEDYFRKAYQINKTSRSAILNFSSKLLDHREHHEAMEVLAPAFKAFPKDRKIAINYATLLIRTGRAAEAEKILRSFQVPDRPHSKTVYYFQLADSLRLQGKNKEADALYLKSLETANENQMKSINFIRQINLKAAGKTKIKK